MIILMDTHAFLWFIEGDDNLSNFARSLIENNQYQKRYKDPFDRLIIAQSLTENIPILTKDELFRSYTKFHYAVFASDIVNIHRRSL